MNKKKIEKFIKVSAGVLGTAFVVTSLVGKKKSAESKFENEPDQKNSLEGKKVIFVENEDEPENADGARGHLEAVGNSDYRMGFYEKYIKRGIDIVLSFGGLVVLSPLLLGISLAIKIDDPGSVLFTQKRMGQNKKYFKLHKFRSMKMSTPHDVPTHMLDNPDQYITKVGKFLRAHSLDELPQIWDIFIGNMSVIGPRPGLWNQDILTAERDKYNANDVKPGLTGWAQINGRDELEIPDKAKLDGEYVSKMGLMMDIKCFLGSVGVFAHDDSVVEGGTGELHNEKYPKKAKVHEDLDFTEEKRVLIFGEGSYIGESFKAYLTKFDNYKIESIDARDDSWKRMDFSRYDVVYDVAGIAHIKERKENKHLYYEVNCNLAVEVAEKAKNEGVKQFIYLSSMSVYGKTMGVIDATTVINPINAYGKSKAKAEERLWELKDNNFIVSIVRPPMVYGRNCKGNYQTLRKFAIKLGAFPDYDNERSMLYIDNLSSTVRGIIHNGESGIYFPQNLDYIKTYDMVKLVAEQNKKNFHEIKMLTIPISIAVKVSNICQKVFGSLVYDQKMNVPESWIEYKDNKETFVKTENGDNMDEKPLVTILTVSYNSEETIGKTIEAVLNQSYDNIEYIIIDGASTDNTVTVAESYKDMFEQTLGKSLRIISEPDKGMYDALNKGARLATGELVGQTNSDDWYEPDAVKTMVELYLKEKYDVAWGSIRVIKPSGNMIKHAKIGKIWTTSGWCHPAMFSRREILIEFPYICESMYDDFDFITAVHKADKKIITIDDVISNFSFGGMSTKKDLKEVKKRVDILYKVYRRHGMSRLYYIQRWGMELIKYLLG